METDYATQRLREESRSARQEFHFLKTYLCKPLLKSRLQRKRNPLPKTYRYQASRAIRQTLNAPVRHLVCTVSQLLAPGYGDLPQNNPENS